MNPFTAHRGKVVTLDRANVDTDQIIAKQFLKSISRTGFGPHLFHDWRYLADGRPDPSFPLNLPRFKDASILVTRDNFGCGSSREHAVWAIQQYGFRVVIAPWRQNPGGRIPAFADIFRNNSFKNALLTVELAPEQVDRIFQCTRDIAGLELTADLVGQRIVVHALTEESYPFEIDATVKERLVKGLDDIGLTLQHTAAIDAFEGRHDTHLPAPARR